MSAPTLERQCDSLDVQQMMKHVFLNKKFVLVPIWVSENVF